ncbi:MAG TPA: response regulator [Bryobacteraceae bacterium]|nr:response regulator [Bryobacteraceae bacterium]
MAFRVLIVDDSPTMRAFVRRVLEMSGFEVSACHQAGNGAEAMAVLRGQPVDVVLTDINMPEVNGEELVGRIEQDQHLRSIPVVVVSTDATANRMRRMMELGAKGYVIKPFSPEALRQEVERVLGVSNV